MRSSLAWLLALGRRVVLITLVPLLVLDLERLLYRRMGYPELISAWRPNPAV